MPHPLARRLLREPLAWFFLVGAVLFALDVASNPAVAPGEEPGVPVTPPPALPDPERLREALREQLAAQKGRPPTEGELEHAVERALREAVLAAEARRLGLGEADPQVRARLAELMLLHLEAAHPPPEPTDAQLRAWFEAHRERYAAPPRVRVEACRVPATEPDDTQRRAEALREALEEGERAGCAPLLPPLPEEAVPVTDLGRRLGTQAEQRLREAEVGRWFGPLSTPAGTLLLRVAERHPGPPLPFERVRERVRADWLQAERMRRREEAVARLLAERLDRPSSGGEASAAGGTP